jgi:predicted nucleotidyltransferase
MSLMEKTNKVNLPSVNERDETALFSGRMKDYLLARPEIVFAYLHGSYLDGAAYRDIDVAVFVRPEEIVPADLFDYAFQLSIELTRELGRDIDVHVLNGAPTGFQNSVFRQGRVLFSRDEGLRLDLIERNSLEAMDFHELSRQFLRECAGP